MNRVSERERRVADRVRDAREQQELSQRELGALIGLTQAGYGHYERGAQPFGLAHLFQLSRLLGRSLAWFLDIDTGLSEQEDHLLAMYRSLSEDDQDRLLRLVRTYAEEPPF